MTAATRVRRAVLAGVALAVALGAARSARAHPLDIGYLRLTSDGAAVRVALDLHVHAAARLLGVAPDALDAGGIARHAAALADASLRIAPITTPGGACRWTAASAARHDTTASLTADAACPAAVDAIRWDVPFVRAAPVSPAFQILVKAQIAGEHRVAIVDRSRPSLELAATRALGLGDFVWTGVEHIGAAPGQWRGPGGWKLPDGIDHILFLFALMLTTPSLVRMLASASGFTLGHSITLALSALHVVRPPARLIEPLIALTIAAVAAQAFAGRRDGHRWKLAAGFGLIHGFGFASALDRLDLATGDLAAALLGYNTGVELGQIAIVLAAAPLVRVLQRRGGAPILRGVAAAIFAAGVYWFFQRL